MGASDKAGERARAAFEEAWRKGDSWGLDAELDRSSRARQIALLGDRRYARALAIGCGAGAFTELLSDRADTVVAVDISPSAIERARQRPRKSHRGSSYGHSRASKALGITPASSRQ